MVSDFLTGLEYFEGRTLLVGVGDLNDNKVTNLTSSYFLNETARICSLESEENGIYNFSCVEHHYWYGIMTFVFIYAPCGATLAAMTGREFASVLCFAWGFIIAIVGFVLTYQVGVSVFTLSLGLFLMFLGILLFAGSLTEAFMASVVDNENERGEHQRSIDLFCIFLFITFPLIILVSPIIMVIIHTIALFQPESKFIKAQKMEVKKGESYLEARPQLILQMFVVMRTMQPSWKQQASIITSSLSICIVDVERYLEKKYGKYGIEFGLNWISLKCFLVHIPSSLFITVISSILLVFFELMSLLIWFAYFIVSAGAFKIVIQCRSQSLMNLENRTYRFKIFLFQDIVYISFYGITLACIGLICNFSPESVVIHTTHINDIIWSELEIVRNIFYLNLAFGSTMAIGVVSLIMEIFIAWYYKDERGRWNWKNTYFHQNLQKTKAMTKRSLKKITKPFDLGPRVMKNPNLRESGF